MPENGDKSRFERLTPKALVAELDRFIIGQNAAKRAVAVALRNRWRRRQLEPKMAAEVLPKNILMVGPTGCGKTEIARRVALFSDAPFIKVEATKFTEVGYVGKDTEQIIRDLVEVSLKMTKDAIAAKAEDRIKQRAATRLAEAARESLGGEDTPSARAQIAKMLEEGTLDDREIEIILEDNSPLVMPTLEAPGMAGTQMGMLNLNEMFGKMLGGKAKKKRLMTIAAAKKAIAQEEAEKTVDEEQARRVAIEAAEENGIVFIDEIDKICSDGGDRPARGEVSREGVQRDLLPLIEGTTVSTRYGAVKTDHILFMASGAFHNARPADLMPELQGRLPVRVELEPLTAEDFERILAEPRYNLIDQYRALLGTEGFAVNFDKGAIKTLAHRAFALNEQVENIGARRLHTVLEKVLEDLSFSATESGGKKFTVTADYVTKRLEQLLGGEELSRLVL